MKNAKNLNYYELIKKYSSELKQRILRLEQLSERLPKGSISYHTKNGNSFFYIPIDRTHRKYISKTEVEKISRLLNAKYISNSLKILNENYSAAERFLKKHSGKEEIDYALSLPLDIQRHTRDLFDFPELIIEEWQNRPFIRNPYLPENEIHESLRGEKLRSKSEAIIANALYSHGIPYKIECPLKLKKESRSIYPDFTILHPTKLTEIYWEHFGMLDDNIYAENFCRRIQQLSELGIKQHDNLICTFETENVPLSAVTIEEQIQEYILE